MRDMLYSLFKVFDVMYGLLAMTIETIQFQQVKAQRDKFSTRPIFSKLLNLYIFE